MKLIKKHWKKLIGILAVIAVLVFAYWYGGAAPGSRGFSVTNDTQETETGTDASVEEDNADDEASVQMAAEDTAGNEDGQQAETAAAADDSLLNEDNTEVSDENSSTDENNNGDTADTGSNASNDKTGNEGAANSSENNVDTGSGKGNGGGSSGGSNSGNTGNAGNSSGSGNSGNTGTGNSSGGGNSGNTGNTGNSSGGNNSGAVENGANDNSGSDDTTESSTAKCTISISCSTILSNMSMLDSTKKSIVPSDGWILKTVTVDIQPGDTVYDILCRVTKSHGISLEYSYTAIYGSYYIEGIANLYEFDCGELSGWMYSVNGKFPNYGCSKYVVSDGDVIKWVYTCNLGADVGNPY